MLSRWAHGPHLHSVIEIHEEERRGGWGGAKQRKQDKFFKSGFKNIRSFVKTIEMNTHEINVNPADRLLIKGLTA